MTTEGHKVERKSIRAIEGDAMDLAKHCIAFANSEGGQLEIGIENGDTLPPSGQQVSAREIEKVRRRIDELTVNVDFDAQIKVATTGQFIVVDVRQSRAIASTRDGRFYKRNADCSIPLGASELQYLMDKRSAQPWETLTTLRVSREAFDPSKRSAFTDAIRASERVKGSVTNKSDTELVDHYSLAIDNWLTNLGILCIGKRADRARLGTAPIIQCITYDENERKINKQSWDDHTLSPVEMVDAIWNDVATFRESYEIPEGMSRTSIPAYDQRVVRELLVNALVHRPYNEQGDIYLNLYPDRLQLVNPGSLPFGVTPQNILHKSVRRNNELARLFHDLNLMEREGSGYDMLYETLASQGRALPAVERGEDYVAVTVWRRLIKPEIIDFMTRISTELQLTQRERITLGILVQHDTLTANQLTDRLNLADDTKSLTNWLGRLLEHRVVGHTGKTRGKCYFVEPSRLRNSSISSHTNLARIEPHRLQELVLEDLRRYPESSFGEIHQRIGPEIPKSLLSRQLKRLVEAGAIQPEGEKRGRRYRLRPTDPGRPEAS